MRRRDFVRLLGAIAAWPHALMAQASRSRPVIGWLGFARIDAPISVRYISQLLRGMSELGYAEGQDFNMLYRSADFDADRLPSAAAELVQLHPDIIVAPATIQAVAAKNATDTIPIVVAALSDPEALGFATSDARPSSNITGITPYVERLPAKQLELAREVVADATRIGVLDDPTDPKAHPQLGEVEAAARQLKINIVPAEVRMQADIGPAYAALAAGAVEVVVVEQGSMLLYARKEIAQAAAAKKLPTVYGYREHVEAGGLISYGVNLDWCFHRAAYYVEKILKGAKPSDLPIEFPTKLELVINLKTAKALGLELSPMLLARADEVID